MMKLFLKYIKHKWRSIVVSAFFILIFSVSLALYNFPLQAVIYPSCLCILFGFVFLLSDFIHTKDKHKMLESMRSITDVAVRKFPRTDSIEDEDYQKIIHLINEEFNIRQMDANRKYSDMLDYYTVWVHQIKTPIASMKLNLQNEDSALSRKLSSELFRVEQYVEMVLTFLRLDSDSTDYVIKEYDLDSIIKCTVKKFAGEFISRKISLIYKPVNTTVITDEKWLSFVIEQVLSNALKYTPSGNISITVDNEKKLCIRDTGIGIAPEDLPRIFENGFTGYNGRYDKKASGIGLYLCRRICTNLGHEIKAQSKVDEGTTVTIDLSQTELSTE